MRVARAVALTGCGRVRTTNEDAVLIFDWVSQAPRPHVVDVRAPYAPPLLCAVADGMGGHRAGELASVAALRKCAELAVDWTTTSAVRTGLAQVSAHVHAAGAKSAETAGMGTTIAGVLVGLQNTLCFNVGDSRVYRVTDGYVEQLSEDHVLVGPDGCSTGRLTQAIGDPPDVRTQPRVVDVPRGPQAARFVLCTDGVIGTGILDTAAFRRLCRTDDPVDLVLNVRAAVYEAGAEDNLSIVVLDVPAPCD